MLTHKKLVKKMLKLPAVKAEYEAQQEEFTLLDQRLRGKRRIIQIDHESARIRKHERQ